MNWESLNKIVDHSDWLYYTVFSLTRPRLGSEVFCTEEIREPLGHCWDSTYSDFQTISYSLVYFYRIHCKGSFI